MTAAGGARDDGDRLVIEIEIEFGATPERVFHRWTDARARARWFAPPGYTTLRSDADPRPGGAWRTEFRSETGHHHYTEHGEFREVDPFERLSFTLTQIDGGRANPETLVTVTLDDVGTAEAPRTRMQFTQSGYRSRSLRDDNEQGWLGCFASLDDDLASIEHTRR